MEYDMIEEWEEPREVINSMEGQVTGMSVTDLGFLCGIIKKYRPKKVVEIGVCFGGTTGVIMNSLNLLGLNNTLVYSIDLSEQVFVDSTKRTGHIYDNLLREKMPNKNMQRFILGKTVADVIEDIGENIDLVIIDTTHELPGEILDFLVVLPYLSESAVVVLHDVGLNYFRILTDSSDCHIRNSKDAISTKVLFHTVKSERKYLNYKDSYPNIGAFEVSEATKDNVLDVIALLSMNWTYLPDERIVQAYRIVIEKKYSKRALQLFDFAVSANHKMYDTIEKKVKQRDSRIIFTGIMKDLNCPVDLHWLQGEEKKLLEEFLDYYNIDRKTDSITNERVCYLIFDNKHKAGLEIGQELKYYIDMSTINGISGMLFDQHEGYIK